MRTPKASDGLFRKNIVLSGGMLLALCAVFCTKLSNALFISIAFAFTGFVSVTLTAIFFSKQGYIFRTCMCALIASLAYIPVYIIAENTVPQICKAAGIYLPLVTVCNIWIFRTQRSFFDKLGFGSGMKHTFFCVLGAVIIFMLVGFVREILAYGSIAGIKLLSKSPFDSASQVWAGLIIIGLIAGIVRKIFSKDN